MKVMFSAGEASGDTHAASVANALREIDPSVEMFGMGGTLMERAGVRIVYDIKNLGVIGIVEIVKSLPKFFKLRTYLKRVMMKEKPDILVCVDYPGFNMKLAAVAHELEIPVLYYIAPTIWAWHSSRGNTIRKYVTKVASIFPFEAEAYRKAGAKVAFVGHPLLDIVKQDKSRAELRSEYDVAADDTVVLLLPGSRKQEIQKLLPPMLEAARILKQRGGRYRFFLPLASTIPRAMVTEQIAAYGVDVTLTDGHTYDLMKMADSAVAASGTVTLEAALLDLPTVVIYKVAALTYWLGKKLVRIPHISLPNIVAGRKVIPELLQEQACGAVIANEINNMLKPEEKLRLAADMAEIRRKLGEPGAVARVAAEIVTVAEGR